MNELIGKTILSIAVNDDQSYLSFETDGGRVAYETEGDCCSETWFADIVGVSALIGGTVFAVEDVDLPDYNAKDGRARQDEDEDKVYGYKIRTDKGYADIVFRNSSNGYYGGSIYLTSSEPPKTMSAITDDWQSP